MPSRREAIGGTFPSVAGPANHFGFSRGTRLRGGFATAVWTDSNGVWTADRPANGKWEAPQLLLPGTSAPIFTMNARGDAAIAWTVGGPPGNQSSVMATLRPAGQGWISPQTVASGLYVTADHAGIGEDGAVIVTWESFAAFCNAEGCSEFNFRLHTSRTMARAGHIQACCREAPTRIRTSPA